VTETLFKQVNYTLGSIVEFIGLGQIGLPDIQRHFVWPNAGLAPPWAPQPGTAGQEVGGGAEGTW